MMILKRERRLFLMKKRSKFLALALVGVLTLGIFAGCGNDEAQTTTSGSASSTASESSASVESSAATENSDAVDTASDEDADAKENNDAEANTATSAHNADIIGEVTVTDGDTLTVDVYEPNTSDVDLLTVTGSDLTATGASEMIETADVINIKQVVDGSLVASSADVIKTGDVVAVVTNDDGTKELLILDMGN
jgi:cytoskeletal protein RodZ